MLEVATGGCMCACLRQRGSMIPAQPLGSEPTKRNPEGFTITMKPKDDEWSFTGVFRNAAETAVSRTWPQPAYTSRELYFLNKYYGNVNEKLDTDETGY